MTFVPTENGIDVAKLSIPEPILFYDEVVLYEDELGDNGSAYLSIKVVLLIFLIDNVVLASHGFFLFDLAEILSSC